MASSTLADLLSRTTFSATTAYAGLVLHKSMQPPSSQFNPSSTSRDAWSVPALRAVYAAFVGYRTYLLSVTGVSAAAALIGPTKFAELLSSSGTYVNGRIDPQYLTWNPKSAAILFAVIVCSRARLSAMDKLGSNFTFELRAPSRLETTGLYRYVQHPSYTALAGAWFAGTHWFLRADGAVAAVLPSSAVQRLQGLQGAMQAVVCLLFLLGMAIRVHDEETMLQKDFGREWEEWAGKTARFVPGLRWIGL